MKLRKIILENFRGFKDRTVISIDPNITAFIGKNDIGKSTIMEALNIFFNDGIEQEDASVDGDASSVRIACSFSDFPKRLVIDAARETSLADEYLLGSDGLLTLERRFNCSLSKPKEISFCAIANHPSNDGLGDLLELKITQLKTRARDLGVDLSDVNTAVSSELRKAIWHSVHLEFSERSIPLDKEDGKKVSDAINAYLPIFSLFKSDRASTDQDEEAQDPLKSAIKQVTDRMEEAFNGIKESVEEKLIEVANDTVRAVSELAPDIASQLVPHVTSKKLESLFSVSLSGDREVPVNKRGSGVRRLILLGFFKAQAERVRDDGEGFKRSIIYAIEEPETSQHPNNQKLLLDSFKELVEDGSCQILLTTHTPVLAERLDERQLRYIRKPDRSQHPEVLLADNDAVRAEIVASLGVLPDNKVRLFVGVEGKNDINFFRAVSRNLAMLHPEEYADLEDEENKGTLVFIPMGGSNLKLWANRLNGTGRKQMFFMDRDNPPPQIPKYQAQFDAFRNAGHAAYMTTRKEMENYIPLSLLRNIYQGYAGTGGGFEDVPALVARAIHDNSESPATWETLSDEDKKKKESSAKGGLNSSVASLINTDALFDECDPEREIRGWFSDIHNALHEAQ